MKRTRHLARALVLVFALCSPNLRAAVSEVRFDEHRLHVKLNVPSQTATIRDEGEVEVTEGWNLMYLNPSAVIDSFTIGGQAVETITALPGDTATLPDYIRNGLPRFEFESEPLLVFFHMDGSVGAGFTLSFHARFMDDVENTRFSNENVGREVRGTILEQGAYLSPSAFFYPQGAEETCQAAVTIDMPVEWQSVSDGNRTAAGMNVDRRQESWANPFESDGIMIMAAPFVTRSQMVDSVEVACYFFAEDTSLIQDYLTATVDYIKMYSDLIGPYPYRRFTVVENFFPTGYGMPAWTLLGQQVIRLPFIIGSSLGHEVLHNWWGNSVYVDYERGNWCEGMTVYGADYRYKLLKSAEEARAYRKDILKQYDSYVDEGNDFPIREFTERTSPDTRTVGYNKTMMVLHMIEETIGTDAFFDAWKRVYAEYRGKRIAWEEWIAAFEATSGQDLSYVLPEWIDRPGAPLIDVEIEQIDITEETSTHPVAFRLSEKSGQGYKLRVPIRLESADFTLDTAVVLTGADSLYTMTLPAEASILAVDPDYDLFRKLYPEEIEPIVSAVMGADGKRFVSHVADAAITGAFAIFATNMAGDSAKVEAEPVPAAFDGAVVMCNPDPLPEYLASRVSSTGDSVTVQGITYAVAGHTFVLTGQNADGAGKYMVVLTGDPESLPRIGQLVPHYGKYSFLVFEGARNVGKGQWDASGSPLVKAL